MQIACNPIAPLSADIMLPNSASDALRLQSSSASRTPTHQLEEESVPSLNSIPVVNTGGEMHSLNFNKTDGNETSTGTVPPAQVI